MKGNNQIFLNQASMCEVVQEWVDREFLRSRGIEVKDVEYNGTDEVFEVSIFCKEEEEED